MQEKSNEFSFLWKRELSIPYGWSALTGGWRWIKEDTGLDVVLHIEAYQGLWGAYASQHPEHTYLEQVTKEVSRHPEKYEQQLAAAHKSGQKFVQFAENIPKLGNLNWDALYKVYQNYFAALDQYAPHLWRMYYLAEAVSRAFHKIIRPHVESDEAVQHYARPSQKSGIYELADYFRKETDLAKRLAFFRENYFWVTLIDPFWPFFNEEQVMDYVRSFSVSEQRPEPATLPLSPKEQRIVRFYQDLLYMKDRRDDYRREAFYLARPLVEEVARRLHITVDDLGLLFVGEVKDFAARSGVLLAEIVKRREGYVIEFGRDMMEMVAGRGSRQNFFEKQTVDLPKVIKGTPGAAGVARGPAQIIRSTREVVNFKSGNILVSITTNPGFVPAMQKALAFVTDEGGVTCHAAIVARELRRPAVVGTKIATKALRDGMMIEVDGTKGEVRVLPQKK